MGGRTGSAEEGPEGLSGPLTGTGERLNDVGGKGRERPWRVRKRESLRVAAAYERLGGMHERRAELVRACGNYLVFRECVDAAHPKRLEGAHFCKDRLCSLCQWRRSLKIGYQVRQVVAEVERTNPGIAWLLMTLTQRNCPGAALAADLDGMLSGWRRFQDMRPVRARVLGSFRALEVTCNREREDYHPHIHALLAVGTRYFRDEYLSQKAWRELWQAALRVEYDPWLDVRRVRDIGGASCEVAKYATKPGDFVSLTGEGGEDSEDEQEAEAGRVEALHAALHRRQLVGHTGRLRVAWQELRARDEVEDVEDGSLVHVGDGEGGGELCKTCGRPTLLHGYAWRTGATWDNGGHVG